ncbi:unnamed protein product [Linum tenue]|uniref:HD domain-containing protein n=1 Tax=Linum tenue TaxID=586396 RepID=A0AAV0L1T4_9ROSI|nr:unnamed protein product [Linum tenue]
MGWTALTSGPVSFDSGSARSVPLPRLAPIAIAWPPPPSSSAIDFLSFCHRLKVEQTCVKMAIVHDIAEAEEIAQLWKEYEDNSSPEAKMVKDFDKVEMILQVLEYENEQGKDLEEFFQSTAGKFQTDVGKAWALEIASRRKGK